jgi:hypothetical protein
MPGGVSPREPIVGGRRLERGRNGLGRESAGGKQKDAGEREMLCIHVWTIMEFNVRPDRRVVALVPFVNVTPLSHRARQRKACH